jgi:site-specific DNA-methyltransferase (adenine-specific)
VNAFRQAGFSIAGHLVFRKRYASAVRYVRYRHESAYILVKGRPAKPANPIDDVIDCPYSGNKLHPTQKPIAALLPLIEAFSRPGDIVLDPFCGSGSTLVAASRSGRRFIGCELDAQYARVAASRLCAQPRC